MEASNARDSPEARLVSKAAYPSDAESDDGDGQIEELPRLDSNAGVDDQVKSPGSDLPSASVLTSPAATTPTSRLQSRSEISKGDSESISAVRLDDDSELKLFPTAPGIDGTSSPQWTRKSKSRRPSTDVNISHHKMHKFSLYETAARYYLVGGDLNDDYFRVLKIDRTAPPGQLNIVEDEVVYDKYQMNNLLTTIDQGNKKSGGMKLRGNSWGLLGFIRFTEAYYMLMITKKQQVAMVGGHYIYQVDDTQLVALTTGPSAQGHSNKSVIEQRYLSILHNLDLHRSFYFSYSYNVTQSLQNNVIRSRQDPHVFDNVKPYENANTNDMFVWNHHLLDPAKDLLSNPYDWCLPIIHGSVDQSSIDVFGRSIWVTLIARRSRFFAGARFLKRGANDRGYVANDVETEQIVAELGTTALKADGGPRLQVPNYTSFIQHRGSIPLYWTQDSSGVSPKPGIELNFIDPFYASAALHFDDLFGRYGAPLTILNLVKSRERTPRERKLLVEYENAIAYLNQALPKDKKIIYRKYDMARAAKTRGQDVIGSLETIAQDLVHRVGFFHNGSGGPSEGSVQNGVIRSNCIDCLDRTNACQFVIGKTALALQLQALGVIAGDHVNYNSDASNILAHMYNDHGDTLASQYGGSHLVNTMDSYQKINNWQSHSRDMLESFKRYYHNSFLDSQRQEAYNLFLGNYKYASDRPMLWDLPSDYWLHHASPEDFFEHKLKRRHYIDWFTPAFLEPRTMPASDQTHAHRPKHSIYDSDWWQEYYKPDILTSFSRSFAYRVNSSTRYLPKHAARRSVDKSPFVVRKAVEDDDASSRFSRHSISPKNGDATPAINPLAASSPPQANAKRIASLTQWLNEPSTHGPTSFPPSAFKSLDAMAQAPISISLNHADKSQMNQWTPEQFHATSLNPTVPSDQSALYSAYLTKEVPPLPGLDPSADILGQSYREYVDKTNRIADEKVEKATLDGREVYAEWVGRGEEEEPLSISEADWDRKRYKVYERWLKGRPLFRVGGKGVLGENAKG